MGQYDSSLHYYNQALAIRVELELNEERLNTMNNIGAVFTALGQYELAKQQYLKALKLADQLQVIGHKEIIVRNISDLYAAQGKYDSAYYYIDKEYLGLKEAVEANYRRSKELEEKLTFEQNQLDLKAIELEKVKAENDARLNLLMAISIGSSLAIVALLLIVRVYRADRKTLRAENSKKEKEKEIERLLSEQEQESVNAMLSGQEKERKRIAQELHDNLGSMLAMVKIHFRAVADQIGLLDAKHRDKYNKGSELLDDACQEVREVSHNLLSGTLVKFGLVPALNELKTTINSAGELSVQLIETGLDTRLNNDIEITLYRIIQELLSNILKHADAEEVTIQLIQKKGNLHVMVEDDGIGFDQSKSLINEGIGLKNIRSRVNYLKGELEIDSNKGGTTVLIDIPIEEALDRRFG